MEISIQIAIILKDMFKNEVIRRQLELKHLLFAVMKIKLILHNVIATYIFKLSKS